MSLSRLWRRSDRLAGTRDGARKLRWRGERSSHVDHLVHGPQRSGPPRPGRSPGLVRAGKESSTTGCDLASWAWRRRTGECTLLGRPACGRAVRGDQPGRDGAAIREVLVRLCRTNRRPGEDARSRLTRAPVASDRPHAHLRARNEHGRSGDAAPRRAPPGPACWCRGDGLGHRPRPPLPPAPRGSLQPRPASSAGASPSAVCSRRRCGRRSAGRPDQAPEAYQRRSPLRQVRTIARSGVPLQVWWSSGDQIVFDQEHQSAAFVRELRLLNHCGPIVSYAGTWRHSQAMWAGSLLPIALAGMGLLPDGFPGIPDGRHQGACVPTAGLSGIPALFATGIRCQLAPGVACT